jgi:aryl-phospho-beta-D-glucosidase BglC (GH1 family)
MLFTPLFALFLVACGGGGGGSSATAAVPVVTTPTPAPATPTTGVYPSYNPNPTPADTTGMSHNAQQLASSIRIGINIGNTMEAIGGETNWGNPLITNDLIQAYKKAGFNAIRLPVSWDQYADKTTGKIDATWLARVKQVVQYCVDNDMYFLVTIHRDGGWL